jgi:hypothetical protein
MNGIWLVRRAGRGRCGALAGVLIMSLVAVDSGWSKAEAAIDGWSEPVRISPAGKWGYPPVLVERGPKGTTTAVYTNHQGSVMAARRPSGGPWVTAQRVGGRNVGSRDLDVGPYGRALVAWTGTTSNQFEYNVQVARFRHGEWTRPATLERPAQGGLDVKAVVSSRALYVVWQRSNTLQMARLARRGWTRPSTLARRVPNFSGFSAAAWHGDMTVVFMRGDGVYTRRVTPSGAMSPLRRLARTRTRFPQVHVSRNGVATAAWVQDYVTEGCVFVTRRPPGGAWSRRQCLRFDVGDAYEGGGFQSLFGAIDMDGNARGDVALAFAVTDAEQDENPQPPQVLVARTTANGTWSSRITSRPGNNPRVALGANRTLAMVWIETNTLEAAWKPMGEAWTPETTVTGTQPPFRDVGFADVVTDGTTITAWTRYDHERNHGLAVRAAMHETPK